jgi:predicted O-methyltransferase YrrM
MSSLRHNAWVLRRAALAAPAIGALPAADLEDVFPGIGDLTISMQHRWRPRGLPHGEAYMLALIVAYLSPRRIFEIGTGTGEATMLMARQAPEAEIDTLDLGNATATLGTGRADAPLEAEPVGEAFRDLEISRRITQHLGDSATFDFSPFRNTMDLVVVDGAHTRRYVRADSDSALSLVRPGGVIVWDDCHLMHPGVGQALLDVRRGGHDIVRLSSSRLAVLWTPGVREEVRQAVTA